MERGRSGRDAGGVLRRAEKIAARGAEPAGLLTDFQKLLMNDGVRLEWPKDLVMK